MFCAYCAQSVLIFELDADRAGLESFLVHVLSGNQRDAVGWQFEVFGCGCVETDTLGVGRVNDRDRLVDHQQQIVVYRFQDRLVLAVGQVFLPEIGFIGLVGIVSVLVMMMTPTALVSFFMLVVMMTPTALVSFFMLVVMMTSAALVSFFMLVMMMTSAALVSFFMLVMMMTPTALVAVLVLVMMMTPAALVSSFVLVMMMAFFPMMVPAAASGKDAAGGVYEYVRAECGLHAVFLLNSVFGVLRKGCHRDDEDLSAEVQWFHNLSCLLFYVR